MRLGSYIVQYVIKKDKLKNMHFYPLQNALKIWEMQHI